MVQDYFKITRGKGIDSLEIGENELIFIRTRNHKSIGGLAVLGLFRGMNDDRIYLNNVSVILKEDSVIQSPLCYSFKDGGEIYVGIERITSVLGSEEFSFLDGYREIISGFEKPYDLSGLIS